MAKIKRKATEPEMHDHCGELEDVDDIGSPEDEEWAAAVRAMSAGEQKEETEQTIVIDTEENDDWMKKLPGYKDEQALHDELAAKLGDSKKRAGKLRRISA